MSRTNAKIKLRNAAVAFLDSLKPVEKSEPTVNEVFYKLYKKHWSKPRFQASGWGPEAERIFLRSISPAFGHSKLTELSAKQIRHWHERQFATPTSANRALDVLSKMFSFAEQEELKPQGTNPCKLVKGFPERKRKRFASPEELVKIAKALDEEAKKNKKAVAFIYLLIFTGSRPSAIERAKWSDLTEFERDGKKFGILKIHGKTSSDSGEFETVILPPQAMRMLEPLSRKSETICGIGMPTQIWYRIRKKAGCEDLWARDFRRTFATIGLSKGESSGIIGEILNHKSAQTTMIYTKLLENSKISATEKIADSIEEILKGSS